MQDTTEDKIRNIKEHISSTLRGMGRYSSGQHTDTANLYLGPNLYGKDYVVSDDSVEIRLAVPSVTPNMGHRAVQDWNKLLKVEGKGPHAKLSNINKEISGVDIILTIPTKSADIEAQLQETSDFIHRIYANVSAINDLGNNIIHEQSNLNYALSDKQAVNQRKHEQILGIKVNTSPENGGTIHIGDGDGIDALTPSQEKHADKIVKKYDADVKRHWADAIDYINKEGSGKFRAK